MTAVVAMVVGASAIRVSIPFRRPFMTASGTWQHRDAWIVRLHAADGRVGSGEACLDPGATPAALEALAAAVRAFVRDGVEPADPDDQVSLALAAAVDGARLDLELVSLAGTGGIAGALAGARSVAVNATVATEDAAESVTAAREAVRAGYGTIKLKGGRERSTDDLVARVRAVRDVVGPTVALRLDVNGAWDLATARARLTGLAPLALEYVEQPVPARDVAALASLRAEGRVAIAVDESVVSAPAARDVLRAGAVDVLVVKPDRVGGPRLALAIAQDAAAAGVGVTISTLLDTGVGLAAAVRVAASLSGGTHGLATADVLAHDLLAVPLTVRGGRMDVPAGPLAIDDAALDRFAVERVGLEAPTAEGRRRTSAHR